MKIGKKKLKRKLLISDMHIPFHRGKMILEIIEKHKDEIDEIIFVGDTVDCEGISIFPKEIRKPLVEEMIEAHTFLTEIDRITPKKKKKFIWGNHEYRFVKYLAMQKSELNPLHSNNILREIVKGFTYYDREGGEVVYPPLSRNFQVIDKWFYQTGDLIVAHPKNFFRPTLRTVVKTIEHFIKRGFKFNTVAIGHTHQWGSTTEYFNVWGMELGCTCEAMDYADSGNINYTPQRYGYAVIAQDEDGITDVNESRLYRIDLEEGE